MKLIVCLDDKNGMLFNRRRQSSDRVLRERILLLTESSRLWMNDYSAKQFEETTSHCCVDEDFLGKALSGEYCFVENVIPEEVYDRVEQLIVYRWNRVYPSDVTFPFERFSPWRLVNQTSFEGYSHPEITEEVYER